MKPPFQHSPITRWELPALERKGCIAQEVIGKKLILVHFHQTHTECTFPNDLPVPRLEKKFKTVPRVDIRDTVAVGFLQKLSEISLVDILTIEGRSVRGKRWPERLETLRLLCDGFNENGKRKFPMAQQWEYGFMKAFDDVSANRKGGGLLVRVPGKTQALLCVEK